MLCISILYKAHTVKSLLTHSITACIILLSTSTFSNQSQEADPSIQQLYHTLPTNPTPMSSRLNIISHYFLGQPYEGNALGEGDDAPYDQGPLYRADGFDCETYVDTVVAIAVSPDFQHFPECIKRVRYQDGIVSFTKRNHFASLDWNQNNQKAGFFQDITESIKNEQGEAVFKTAEAYINKPKWYQDLPKERIRLPNASEKTQKKQLKALRREGKKLKAETARIPYIPLTALFDDKGKPNLYLFRQIPDGAIIEIVRPNWDLSTRIGSHLNVSHMGFVFHKNGKLRFRHASLLKKKVSDVSLIAYLKNALDSPTIRGINIQVVVAEQCKK